jgi:hypothetical protein
MTFGAAAAATPGSLSSGSSTIAASASTPPLWTGGKAVSPTAKPYNLAVVGSIYYTTSPNALTACTKATATLH